MVDEHGRGFGKALSVHEVHLWYQLLNVVNTYINTTPPSLKHPPHGLLGGIFNMGGGWGCFILVCRVQNLNP